jgi:hypothetical protein
MDVAPYLYCAIDDSDLHSIFSMTICGPAQHILYDHLIFSIWNFARYFGYREEVINGYALH